MPPDGPEGSDVFSGPSALTWSLGSLALFPPDPRAPEGEGRPLDAPVRRTLETQLGADLSAVRIHTDDRAARLAKTLDAAAVTVGSHIAFAEGAYRPHTSRGRGLLGHELVHVLQNRAHPPVRGMNRTGRPDHPAEQQAHRQGTLVQYGASLPPWIPAEAAGLFSLAPGDWYRGEAEGVPVAKDSAGGNRGVVHDLGDGTYYTDTLSVARTYAEMRETQAGTGRVIGGTVDPQSLGKVLDLTQDPQFMATYNYVASKLPGAVAGEPYRNMVDNHLKQRNLRLSDFDVIIGPEGIRGGLQMCVRNPQAAQTVRAAMKVIPPNSSPGSSGRGGPSGTPPPEHEDSGESPPPPGKTPAKPPAGDAPHEEGHEAPPKSSGKAPPGRPGVLPEEHDDHGGTALAIGLGQFGAQLVTFFGQQYMDKVWDEINKKRYAEEMKKLEPQIAAAIDAKKGEAERLTMRGGAAYARVNLVVWYMSAPDIQTEIVETHLTKIDLGEIKVESSPSAVVQQEIPTDWKDPKVWLQRGVFHITWTQVAISYSVPLVKSLDDQKKDTDDEVNRLEQQMKALKEPGGKPVPQEDIDALQAKLDDAKAAQAGVMRKRVVVWNRYEADRKRKEQEEKKKQQDVLDRYDAQKDAPPQESDSKSLLDAPTKAPDAQDDLEKVLPGFTTNKGIDKATDMARLFVAQRDRMLGRAEWLRGKADKESGSKEYSEVYSKLVAERDQWPSQLQFCLAWVRENVPGAKDAIRMMAELQDWLKNGGWAQLTEVQKPG